MDEFCFKDFNVFVVSYVLLNIVIPIGNWYF